jgi:Tfp pilus assembly protein PilF
MMKSDAERLQHAEKMCGHWLYLANQAAEKGNKELAEMRYKKAQPWLDKINRILGNS